MANVGTTLVGRYRLDSLLGQGGMGVVFRATDLRLDREVAVKTVSAAVLASPEAPVFVEQLAREAMLLAKLAHGNLATVHDAFVAGGQPYFVMELVPGRTVEQAMETAPPLPDRRPWLAQLLDAVDYLHGRTPPVVIRDLKPANLILAPDGTLKVVDFGIARSLAGSGLTHPLLRGYGTEGYAPPEAYLGRSLDRASDLYSLGGVIYFVLTGSHPPMEGPPESDFAPEAPGVASLVRRLMAPRAEDRPAGMAEVRGAFDAAWPPGEPPSRIVWREKAPQTQQLGDDAPGRRGPVAWRDLDP